MVEWCAKDIRQFDIIEDEGLKCFGQEMIKIGSMYGNINIKDILDS